MSKKNKKVDNAEKPLYVARKSIFAVLNLWWVIRLIIAAALIGGGIYMIVSGMMPVLKILYFALIAVGAVWVIALFWKLVRVKTYRFKVYERKIVTRIGIMIKTESTQELFLGIIAVNIDQGFWGNLNDFGSVHVVCMGRPDVYLDHIVDPRSLVRFLSGKFVKAEASKMLIYN